jgi:hypothetical protein
MKLSSLFKKSLEPTPAPVDWRIQREQKKAERLAILSWIQAQLYHPARLVGEVPGRHKEDPHTKTLRKIAEHSRKINRQRSK